MNLLPYDASTYSKSWVAFGRDAPLQVTHGDGWRVFDVDGHGYVDCIMGLGSVVCGHRHPHIDSAIRHALCSGTAASLAHPSELIAAERVLEHFPNGCMLQWGVNGSDATTGALRLARIVTGAPWIVMADDGYHGFHDWCLAGTTRGHGIPDTDWVIRIKALEELTHSDEHIAAVIIEPDLHPTWLQPIRAWCTANDALMICDEVMTWQRYPKWTASAYYDVVPDLWTLGKSLGNGMPVSAIVGSAEVMRRFAPSTALNAFFSATWAGHPLSMAAVIATLDVMEREDGPRRIWKRADELNKAIFPYSVEWRMEHPTPPFNRIHWENQVNQRWWRKLMNDAGVLIYAAHNLSLAHDDNAMQRILDGWKHVALNADKLLAAEAKSEPGNGVMRR